MINVKIDFDDQALIPLTRGLSGSALAKATKRAVRKTALWVRTHLLRKLKDEGMRRKCIVHRVRIYDKAWRAGGGGGFATKVWFGINSIPADTLGKPVKTKTGYRVKSWRFDNAFVPTKNARMAGKLYVRTTARRMPVQRAQVQIDADANAAFSEIAGQVPARFQALMIQELRYELLKLAGAVKNA